MSEFFWSELHSEKWMPSARRRAISTPPGTFVRTPVVLALTLAWPPNERKGFIQDRSARQDSPWLTEIAKAGIRDRSAGHFVEDIFPPVNGGAFKSVGGCAILSKTGAARWRAFSELVIDSIFGATSRYRMEIRVQSHLAEFDPNARLEGLNYQGS